MEKTLASREFPGDYTSELISRYLVESPNNMKNVFQEFPKLNSENVKYGSILPEKWASA